MAGKPAMVLPNPYIFYPATGQLKTRQVRGASVSVLSQWLSSFPKLPKANITFSDGYLGSRNDEERSEMRYVLRLAEPSESSNLRTHLALPGIPGSMLVGVSAENPSPPLV